MERQQWINEILKSTDQIKSVAPNEILFLKIQQRIKAEKSVSLQWVWLAAASIVLLFGLNIKIAFSSSENKKTDGMTLVSSISKSNQFYTNG